MKVIFIPDYRHVNSYQRHLAEALSNQGAAVHFGNFFGLFAVLRSAWKYWKPDILHVHWTHPFTIGHSRIGTFIRSADFIFELLLLRLSGIRIIWTVHNIADHEGKFISLELFFNRLLARTCNRLIVHCPSAKKEVADAYSINGSSIEVIPHGNYIGLYRNVITCSEAREKLELNAEDRLFLYFGQIRPYKGILELIDAFEKLDYRQARLLIAGKPLNDEVAADILNRCRSNNRIKTVFEFIPDNEVQDYMNAADVVVLPYRDILTSGAVMAAISFGKPVIAPAIGCIADILDENGSFLYPKTDSGLLEAMRCVLCTDTTALLNMGRYNLTLAGQLGWDDIGRKSYDVYKGCLA